MRLPLRSCCIFRSFIIQKLAVETQRRSLSGAAMRLVQFRCSGDGDGIRVGVEQGEGLGVVDLKAFDSSMPSTVRELLQLGDKGLECAQRALASGQFVVDRANIQLLPPILAPEKVVCVGMNYRDHCLEQNAPIPEEPIIFSKFPSAITGPYDDIILPPESQVGFLLVTAWTATPPVAEIRYHRGEGFVFQHLNLSQMGDYDFKKQKEVDWEVELAFVIGRRGKDIKEEEALSYVAGFTVANDVSARDWQMRRNGKQWLLSKTFDSFCPLGPALVTADAVTDPHNLGIRCLVNGDTVQSSNTSQMIFKMPALIAWVSKFVTLTPGDVFLTGTPPGVGVFRNPPVFLKKGDVVECQIDQLGSIINKVI